MTLLKAISPTLRCLRCQRAASRPRRSRLNGRRVSAGQIPLI